MLQLPSLSDQKIVRRTLHYATGLSQKEELNHHWGTLMESNSTNPEMCNRNSQFENNACSALARMVAYQAPMRDMTLKFVFDGFYSRNLNYSLAEVITLVTKAPREDFFRKVLPHKIFFGVFMSCSASCQGTYCRSHEKKKNNSWRITGPFWRRVILDIRTRHMLRLHAHPPRQTPSAQRKRFSTRCICTQTLWGDLLCSARRSVVAYCEETFLGLDLWWGFFGRIFWWDFFRAFSAGKQPQKSAAKIRTPKSAQAITKSAKKIRTPKSANAKHGEEKLPFPGKLQASLSHQSGESSNWSRSSWGREALHLALPLGPGLSKIRGHKGC